MSYIPSKLYKEDISNGATIDISTFPGVRSIFTLDITQNTTVNIVTDEHLPTEIIFKISNVGNGNKTVTFGTRLNSGGTLSAKKGNENTITFLRTNGEFYETSRVEKI